MYEVAREFLTAVLADQPRYVGAIQRHGRKGLWQNYFPTIDALAHWLMKEDGPGKEVYFALGSFGEVDSRESVNVHTLKSLWIDMDCGPGKAYPTIDDALRALDRFLDDGFPCYSYLIKSGYGLHVYWVLDRPAPRAQWFIAASAFQSAWQAHGIKGDPVSADAARVLRCPGTHNHKHGGSAPVEIIEGTGEIHPLASLHEAAQKFAPAAPVRNPAMDALGSNDDLLSSLPERKAYLVPVVKKCKQLARVAKNKGADCSEPLWYATIQLCRHLEEGAAAAQFMSSGHPDYDPHAVEDKLDQLESKDIGPTTCERFKAVNPAGCEGCTWQITSPIQLGEKEREVVEPKIVVTEAVTTADGEVVVEEKTLTSLVPPPHGFRFTGEGTEVEIKDPKGIPRWQIIFHGAIFPTRIHRTPGHGLELEVHWQVYSTGAQGSFSMPMAKVGETKELRSAILAQTVIDGASATHLQRMINLMAVELQNRARAVGAARQLGWQLGDPAAKNYFVLGTTRFSPAGPEHNVPISAQLETAVGTLLAREGSLEGAKRGAALFARPGGEMHQAVYLTGLAGVFAPFTGAQNFAVLSLVSRIGGEGKTTNCDAALSHWFNPIMARSTPNDTMNAVVNTMSIRGTLPVFIDEVTNTRADTAVSLLYTASQGREKARMEQSGARQREPMPPWKCPVLVTSNMSVKQLVRASRGDAAALDARIVELRYHRLDLTPEERAEIGRVFYENYGWTGPAVAHHVAMNMEAYRAEAELVRERLVKAMGWDGSDRFWLNWAVGVILSATAMHRLELANYPIGPLFVFIVQLLMQQRALKHADVRTASDILAEFLAEFAGQIAVGYRAENNQAAVARFAAFLPNQSGTLVGRSQLDENVLYVARNPLRDFCTSRGYDFRSFEDEAAEQGLVAKTRTVWVDDREVIEPGVPMTFSLGRNTPLASAPVRCIPFSLRHVALRDHLAQAREAVVSQNGKVTWTDGRAA